MRAITEALVWTFMHSLWQGLIAALIAAIIVTCTRRSGASLRYGMLSLLLLAFLVTSMITFLLQWKMASSSVANAGITQAIDINTSFVSNKLMVQFTSWVNGNSTLIISAWAFFFLLACLRMAAGIAGINRLRNYRTHPVSEDWKLKLEDLQERLGIKQTVRLLQSELVKVPVALGMLKPVILIPIGLLNHLPPAQIETILLHELAHIKRRDYLANIFQHIIEALFFFNPAIRWISALIREEREACCDDLVVAVNKEKKNYFEALVAFQEFAAARNSFALGIGGRRPYLLNRIRRMVTNRNTGLGLFEKLCLVAGIVLFSAFNYLTKEKELIVKSQVIEKPITVSLKFQPVLPVQTPVNRDVNKLDTVPAPKKIKTAATPAQPKTVNSPEQPKVITQKDADAALQEIVRLKDEIGLKKESIGDKKQKLGVAATEPEKAKIQQALNKDRQEIIDKRAELDAQRKKWDFLKKEVEKNKQRKPEPRKLFGQKPEARIFGNNEKNIFGKREKNTAIRDQRSEQDKKNVTIEMSKESKKEISNDKTKETNVDRDPSIKKDLQIKNPPPIKPPGAPAKQTPPATPAKKVQI